MKYKFKKGDRVLYQGLIGIVIGRWKSTDKKNSYDLISEENEELTCSARESECELVLQDDEIDQSEALVMASLASKRITNMVGGLTDSHFRDGCH